MTRTEELREKLAIAFYERYATYYGLSTSFWEDALSKDYWRASADVAIKACAEAGLAFVDKDAVIPKLDEFAIAKCSSSAPRYNLINQEKCAEKVICMQCQLLTDKGWQKTEKIEVSEK